MIRLGLPRLRGHFPSLSRHDGVSMSPKVTKRKRRPFTPEFKAEAVRLVRGSGKTVAKVARELDLTATCLRAWVNQAEADEKGSGQGALTTDERA